jgi:hypothetical protein
MREPILAKRGSYSVTSKGWAKIRQAGFFSQIAFNYFKLKNLIFGDQPTP